MTDEELLNYLYYEKKNFDGINELYRKAKVQHPKINLGTVKDWLNKQQTAQLNDKPVKQNNFLPIYSESPYAFQIDLTFFPRYKKQNDNNYVLFTAININSRFAYAYYSKDKNMNTILDILKQMEKKTIINSIYCDEGTEFNNKEFKDFCEKESINLIMFKDDSHKLGIINRFHRTLKDKLTKYFNAEDSVRWVDVIDDIINNYNNTINRGIGFKPIEVNSFIENYLIEQAKEKTGQIIKDDYSDIKEGLYCRILNKNKLFSDKMTSKYNDQVFKIMKIKNNSVIVENINDDSIEYEVKKSNIKIIPKPERVKELKEQKIASKENKVVRKLKKDDMNENNIINVREERIRRPNQFYL